MISNSVYHAYVFELFSKRIHSNRFSSAIALIVRQIPIFSCNYLILQSVKILKHFP